MSITRIAGPKKLLTESEINTIKKFVDEGCTESEWNNFCDSVKFDPDRDRQYPEDWFQFVNCSGRLQTIVNSSRYKDSVQKSIEEILRKRKQLS